MDERTARVVEVVRGELGKLGHRDLLTVGMAATAVVCALTVTETTARRYVAAALETSELIEVGHVGRKLDLPWPADVTEPPDVWLTGNLRRQHYYLTEHRQPGPQLARTRFVMTPEHLKELMDLKLQEQAGRRAQEQQRQEKRAQETAARNAASWAVLVEQRPVLAGLLRRLDAELAPAQEGEPAVRVSAREHPDVGLYGHVALSVGIEAFDVLERVLRDGLGEEQV